MRKRNTHETGRIVTVIVTVVIEHVIWLMLDCEPYHLINVMAK